MFDFADVHAASKDQQIRAFSLEQAVEFCRDQTAIGTGTTSANLINVSKMIEDYVTHGDTTSSITAAMEEGLTSVKTASRDGSTT